MLYPELLDEAKMHLKNNNPELIESVDWLLLKANILGDFPCALNNSQELLEYLVSSKHMTHPAAIVGSFITIISGLTARRIFTETECSTPLYTIIIAPTGSGKDIVTSIPRLLLNHVNRHEMTIVQAKIFSEGALDAIFKDNNIVVQIIDEFGDQLGQMLKDNSGHLKALMQKYKTLYSSTNGIYESAKYSNAGGRIKLDPFIKEKPSFILTGAATKLQLMNQLKEEMLYDGFLNRFIILDGSNMEPLTKQTMIHKSIPINISAHLNHFTTNVIIANSVGYKENISQDGEFLTIPMSNDAREYYWKNIGDAYENGSDIYILRQSDTTGVLQEVSARWRENALRLATAVTAYELHAKVELETLKWAYAFVKKSSRSFLNTFQQEAQKTKYEKDYDNALQWFKSNCLKGQWHEISKLSQKARVFKNLKISGTKQLIDALLDDEVIERSPDGKSVRFKN